MTPKQDTSKISVFISSTFNDLKEYRAEVETQLDTMEKTVKNMEHFGAVSSTPIDTCRQRISECQLMVLMIGVSYGSIEETTGKSFTELEYAFATEQDIPVLAYVLDYDSTDIDIPISAFDFENKEKLDQFRRRVEAERTVSRFTSISDLSSRIMHDVPAELERINAIQPNDSEEMLARESVTDDDLIEGARKFERFWLRPKRMSGKTYPLRLRINKKLSGWKLKDGLIRSLGLTIGDTISTEVSVLFCENLIDDRGDTDLFADGSGADWILDQCEQAGSAIGCTIDCYVRFVYEKAPVGSIDGDSVYKASLVFVKGIRFVELSDDCETQGASRSEIMSMLRMLSK